MHDTDIYDEHIEEQQDAGGEAAHYAQMSYDLEPYKAVCAVCFVVVQDTRAELEKRGWLIGKTDVCPTKNLAHANFRMGRASRLCDEVEAGTF